MPEDEWGLLRDRITDRRHVELTSRDLLQLGDRARIRFQAFKALRGDGIRHGRAASNSGPIGAASRCDIGNWPCRRSSQELAGRQIEIDGRIG